MGLKHLDLARPQSTARRQNEEKPERGIETSMIGSLLLFCVRQNEEKPERGIETSRCRFRRTRTNSSGQNEEKPERGIETHITSTLHLMNLGSERGKARAWD